MYHSNFLFVYGSLRQGFNSPAFEYISKYYNLLGVAKAKGKMVDLGEYPAVVPTNDNNFVTGELYQIKNEKELAWALIQLDDYEGVLVEANETPDYKRAITEVYFDSTIVQANVYWYNKSIEGYPLVESGDIFEYIKMKP